MTPTQNLLSGAAAVYWISRANLGLRGSTTTGLLHWRGAVFTVEWMEREKGTFVRFGARCSSGRHSFSPFKQATVHECGESKAVQQALMAQEFVLLKHDLTTASRGAEAVETMLTTLGAPPLDAVLAASDFEDVFLELQAPPVLAKRPWRSPEVAMVEEEVELKLLAEKILGTAPTAARAGRGKKRSLA